MTEQHFRALIDDMIVQCRKDHREHVIMMRVYAAIIGVIALCAVGLAVSMGGVNG
jgi:hypothetical protein